MKTDTFIQENNKDSIYGLVEFFSSQYYFYTVKTIVFCTVYKLSLQELKE